MTCPHDRTRILTYDAMPYRWIYQCQHCGKLFATTLDNYRIALTPDKDFREPPPDDELSV